MCTRQRDPMLSLYLHLSYSVAYFTNSEKRMASHTQTFDYEWSDDEMPHLLTALNRPCGVRQELLLPTLIAHRERTLTRISLLFVTQQ
jgi:hypothetical protein